MGGTGPGELAAAVVDAFGLGAPLGPPRPVSGGRSHLMWRLATTTGEYAVKQLHRSTEAWWLRDYRVAARVEQVAFEAGIAMPEPIHPARPAAPLLAQVSVAGQLLGVRVHRWVPGEALPCGPPPAPVLRWVGATLAALHTLPVGLDPAQAVLYEPHSPHEWADWLAERGAGAPELARTVAGFLPDIEEATAHVEAARALVGPELALRYTHRDLKPDNVLLGAAAPVLVDWDGAGPDFAQWEATRAALAFARTPTGWDRAAFELVMRSYRGAGGLPVAPRAESFAGVLRQQLGAAAWLLWRALGYRPASPAERDAAREHLREMLADLRAARDRLPEWAGWLAAAA